MELKTIQDSFDHVTKRQKLCSSNCHEAVEQVGWEIEQALAKLQTAYAASPDHKSVLAELKTKLKDIAPLSQLESSQKELNVAFSKHTKQLERSFNPNISKANRNVDFDIHIVNEIIAGHLYRQGMFKVGDCFINDAGEREAAALKFPFIELYHIREAMKSRDPEPALKWVAANRENLKEKASDLDFKLYRLQHVEILLNKGKGEALEYGRAFLSPFAETHVKEIQKLMACLLWDGKLHSSPYTDLLSPTNWDKLSEELASEFCKLIGQPSESPLSVTVAAGVQALPTLLKLMSIMPGKKQEWQSMKHMPVPVDLGKEFQFHTLFVCPVSRDQATDENPPMLMSCGHVLCLHSIVKLSKSTTKSFKCPYCPHENEALQCRRLFF